MHNLRKCDFPDFLCKLAANNEKSIHSYHKNIATVHNNNNNNNSLARRQIPDIGSDSSQHFGRLIPACYVPLCRWRCWNCFSKEGIQIFCPSFRLSIPTDRLREFRPAEWVGSWLPERGRSSLECLIPRSMQDLFPVPAAVSLDTVLQLGAHSWVILSFVRPLATVDILFLALGLYTPKGEKENNNNN